MSSRFRTKFDRRTKRESMLRPLTCLLCLLVGTSATAQDQVETIGRKLDEARKAVVRTEDSARRAFLAEMTKQSELAAKRSDLEAVKRIDAEREAFETDGKLPTNPYVALSRKRFETELSRSKFALKKTLESAKSEYVKAKRLAEAEAIESELRADAPKVVQRVEKEQIPVDPIVGFWRLVIGEKDRKQIIVNVYFPPVDNPGVRSAMARRNQTSPVKYFQGSWSKSGDIYTLHGPNGSTAKVKMRGAGEGFLGRMAAGAPVVGFRQQR